MIEVRRVFEMEDFPQDIREAAEQRPQEFGHEA
jgi:hypothetical protein